MYDGKTRQCLGLRMAGNHEANIMSLHCRSHDGVVILLSECQLRHVLPSVAANVVHSLRRFNDSISVTKYKSSALELRQNLKYNQANACIHTYTTMHAYILNYSNIQSIIHTP